MATELWDRTAVSRRRLIAGATLGLGGAALAACGPVGTGDGAGPAPPAAQEAAEPEETPIRAEAGQGATVIDFWNGLTGPDGEGMVRL
ncbi:MAG: hypothetical protein ACRDI2_11635, partial [Chloroflexota bacterium]